MQLIVMTDDDNKELKLLAPLEGKILEMAVREGDSLVVGDRVCVISPNQSFNAS